MDKYSAPSVASSSSSRSMDNQSTHDPVLLESLSPTAAGVLTRAALHSVANPAAPAVSHLNTNERMMLDLLDKTISTQEVLAAQQHAMANVMDYHGSQLQRISSAIDRVENILHTNGDKLKQLHTFRSQVKDHQRRRGAEHSHRVSIAL
jgi:hypothetical protein